MTIWPWIRLALILLSFPFVVLGIVYVWQKPYFPIVTAIKKACPLASIIALYMLTGIWLIGIPNSPEYAQAGWSLAVLVIIAGGALFGAVSAQFFDKLTDLIRVRIAAFFLLRAIQKAYAEAENQKETTP